MVNPTRSFFPTIESAYSTDIIGTSEFYFSIKNKKVIKLLVESFTFVTVNLNHEFNERLAIFCHYKFMNNYFRSLQQVDIFQGYAPENCLVWNLGDVLLNRHVSEGEAMNTILRMKKNRKLNLILGNHDFQCDKGQHKNYIEYFTSLGFDEVYNKPIIFDDKYILSHEPVFIPEDRDFINIHGHTHHRFVKEDFFLSEYNKSFPKKKVNPKAYINVCMDANDLKIHCLRDLIDLG